MTEITAAQIVDHLNLLMARCPDQIRAIYGMTMQLGSHDLDTAVVTDEDGWFTFIGILNGMFEFDADKSGGAIAALLSNGELVGFRLNHDG